MASTGSTRRARTAGTVVATTAVATSAAVTTANTAGSRGDVRKRSGSTSGAAATAMRNEDADERDAHGRTFVDT